MLSALASSVSGVRAGVARLDRAANEIANVNTTGYRSRGGIERPGAIAATGNPLDLAIQGNGFFRIAAHDGSSFGEVLLTRAGDFHRDAQGFVSASDGRYVVGLALDASGSPTSTETRLQVPLGTTSLTVGAGGIVEARLADGATVAIGAISLATVPSPNGLEAVSGSAFRTSAASGAASVGPAGGSAGTIASGALEGSNADLPAALVETLLARHDVRANTRSLEAADMILRELTAVDRRA